MATSTQFPIKDVLTPHDIKRPKTPKNQKIGGTGHGMDVYAGSVVDGGFWRQALSAFALRQVGLDGSFPWCQGAKKKICFQNVHF